MAVKQQKNRTFFNINMDLSLIIYDLFNLLLIYFKNFYLRIISLNIYYFFLAILYFSFKYKFMYSR